MSRVWVVVLVVWRCLYLDYVDEELLVIWMLKVEWLYLGVMGVNLVWILD